jgi:hypothetical protein
VLLRSALFDPSSVQFLGLLEAVAFGVDLDELGA